MGSACFYFCKLFFVMGQLISWYIVANYVFVILPNSNPTKNQTLNLFLIVINYLLHFAFVGLHQYSYIMVSFVDAGYVSTHFDAQRELQSDIEN